MSGPAASTAGAVGDETAVIVVVAGGRDVALHTARLIREAGIADPTIACVSSEDFGRQTLEDLGPEIVGSVDMRPGQRERLIKFALRDAEPVCDPLVERGRPVRDWEQRERQRPRKRRGRP